jgi:hypothetical protein
VRGEVAYEDTAHIPTEHLSCTSVGSNNLDIIDLYAVGCEPKVADETRQTLPFIHQVGLKGMRGEIVRVRGLFDDGAMVSAMCSTVFNKIKGRLGAWKPSQRRMRMANGTVILSEARWRGTACLGDVTAEIEFEVFNSGGNWAFLFSKPSLETFKAIHNYETDTILVAGANKSCTLTNQARHPYYVQSSRSMGVNLALDVKQYNERRQARGATAKEPETTFRETPIQTTQKSNVDKSQPEHRKTTKRRVPKNIRKARQRERRKQITLARRPKALIAGGRRWMRRRLSGKGLNHGRENVNPQVQTEQKSTQTLGNDMNVRNPATELKTESTPICIVADNEETQDADVGTEIPTAGLETNTSIYTRHTYPFKPERVKAVVNAVTFGKDLNETERDEARQLIEEFADCFALAVSEVTQVPEAIHHLNIPENAKFSTKVHQRPLTPPQKQFLDKKINEMLEAGIIEHVEPSRVKCVSPTTLAQKAHEGGGLTLEELQQRVNTECIAAGIEPYFDSQVSEAAPRITKQNTKEQKWRVCQNFAEVNRVTEIAAMPQGDIRLKQQRLSGHRYTSVFDFASGFYAVKVDEESRPYTAFYVEGRGYFWYARMPFGLTGAPSTFAHMTATHLHDLLTNEIMELFVDDGGTADDTFKGMVTKLRCIFTRVRERKLSLSAAKSQFFMTEAVFAGGRVV